MKTKFRAWDKTTRYMDYRLRFSTVADEIEVLDGWSTWRQLRKGDYKLMQYTGLNDSNGVEIYEGDIGWDDVRERYGNVDFIDGKFCYISENDYEDLCEVCNDIVIRGNIYQNKELLEGE